MSQVEEWIDKDKAMANGIVDVFLGKSVFMVQVKGDMLKRLRKVKRKVEKSTGAKMDEEALACAVLLRGIEAMEEIWS